MKIYNNIEIVDLALKYKDNLIFGDIHIGLEECMNKQGILIPRFQLEEIFKRLDKIFSKVKVKNIIINGDIKHEFGTISRQEWRDTLRVLDYLMEKGNVILIKGNHDTILGPIADKKEIKVLDYYNIDNITVLHGDKIIPDLNKILIIGHEHPAISFKERMSEKFKCFLKGSYRKHVLIVQPSFNFVTEGTNILKEKLLSPFLQQDLSKFEVFVVEDKVYRFGKLNSLN
jgi:putative SbcD/Mre11-related phosphoesterase